MGGATTTYTWDVGAGLPAVLQDGTHTYVYGLGGQMVSQTDVAGVQSYVLTDGLGSTAALADISGNVTANYAYDAFGAVRQQSGEAGTDYRFTGQQQEASTGLTYLRARYYDPSTGHFLTKDPFSGVAGLTQSQHPYAYAHKCPQNLNMKDGTATPTIRPPVIVDGQGDVLVFSDVTYASSYSEAIDVLEGAYPACYDSEGRLLTLSADGDVVDIRSDNSEPHQQAELRSLLVDLLERVGHEKGRVADLPLQYLRTGGSPRIPASPRRLGPTRLRPQDRFCCASAGWYGHSRSGLWRIGTRAAPVRRRSTTSLHQSARPTSENSG